MKILSRLYYVAFLWCNLLIICSCGPENNDQVVNGIAFDSLGTLTVAGMTCTSCEAALKGKLQKIDGVASVEASWGNDLEDNVKVKFDSSKTGLENIKNAINNNKKFKVTKSISIKIKES